MSHKRRILIAILPVTILAVLSCSWSPKQQEILDAYNETTGFIDRNEWESAVSSIDSSTMLFVDSLAANLSARGLQRYDSGEDLLPVLCLEYIDFNGDVTMIFVQGNRAEITLSSTDTQYFPMNFEGGVWKLSLESIFRTRIDTALDGSYL